MNRTLYKLGARGQVLQFTVGVAEGNYGEVKMVTIKGQYGGAMQEDEKYFEEGKNLGRANETSPYQQANNEAEGIINKLLDKGYKEPQFPVLNDDHQMGLILQRWLLEQGKGTDASGNLKPMLAQKNPNKIIFPCYGQRKYDGIRCFTHITKKGATMYSRNGKEFRYLGHIKRDLLAWFFDFEGIIDGELYSHTMTFQAIVSAVKREQAANKQIQLRIYDIIPFNDLTLTQDERMENLITERVDLKISGKEKEFSFEFAKTYKMEDWDKLRKLFSRFIAEGYEGLMARLPNYPYQFGIRSHSLIKYKEFDEDEFQICGVDEAEGRDEGTAIFIMKDLENDIVFRARPMGDRELRADYYNNKDKYIGKMGTVKYQGRSEDKIPRFPVFKIVRTYE
jgi:DNA ligase-1